MEIGPLNRMPAPVPVASDAVPESLSVMRELVVAIRGLNQSEFLPQGRELKLRRGAAGKRPGVDLVDAETGEILDEVAPETILRMMAERDKEHEGEL